MGWACGSLAARGDPPPPMPAPRRGSGSTRARFLSDSTCRAWRWPGLAGSARLPWNSRSRASLVYMTWSAPGIHCSAEAQWTKASAKPRSHGHPARRPYGSCRGSRTGAGRSGPSASCSHLYPRRESGPRPHAGPSTVEAASPPSRAASSAARQADSAARYIPYNQYSCCPAWGSLSSPTRASGTKPMPLRHTGHAIGSASALALL